jgi:hypothetical protein
MWLWSVLRPAVARQLVLLVLTVLSIMFLSAGLFHMVESTM